MSIDQRPRWAQLLVAERIARGWSQQDLVNVIRQASPAALPSDSSMLRSLKGWEAGQHRPGEKYQRLIATAFGTIPQAIFTHRGMPESDASEAVPALEFVERLLASDLDTEVLHAAQVKADKLCTEYSWAEPHQLLAEATAWLHYLDGCRSAKLTIGEHQRLMEIAGWLTLLVATISFDLADYQTAEGVRRVALRHGQDTKNVEIEAWAHELAAWFNLAHGRWERVVAAARSGQAVVQRHGVAAQLAVQEAEALARLGASRESETALGRAQGIIESLPAPGDPLHHFHVDHDKFDKVLMHIHLLQGNDDEAQLLSEELERKFTDADGVMTKPMRVADARGVRAVVAVRQGDVDSALDLGHSAFDIERQTIPSLVKNTVKLAEVLNDAYPSHGGSRDLLARRRQLATRAGSGLLGDD